MKARLPPSNMKRALAQNPNLIRTLIGLGLTLIFVLSYAVYGATIDSEYYVYSSSSEENDAELVMLNRSVSSDVDGEETTQWIWQTEINVSNLSWINTSLENAPDGTTLKVVNMAGWYSHAELGNKDAEIFNCASNCRKAESHSSTVENGGTSIIGLTNPDPAMRDGGTVRAKDIDEAREMARDIMSNEFGEKKWEIRVIMPGNHSDEPIITMEYVNEELSDISQFSLDTATELMWSMAAVIGCFIMVLVPVMTIYLFTRGNEDVDIDLLNSNVEEE